MLLNSLLCSQSWSSTILKKQFLHFFRPSVNFVNYNSLNKLKLENKFFIQLFIQFNSIRFNSPLNLKFTKFKTVFNILSTKFYFNLFQPRKLLLKIKLRKTKQKYLSLYNDSLRSYIFVCIYVSYSDPNGWTELAEICWGNPSVPGE